MKPKQTQTMADVSDERLAQILASANSRASYEVCSYLDNAEMVRLITELQARRAAEAGAVEALRSLVQHIDHIAYRDSAGLRLGEVNPFYERARAALGARND